MMIDLPTNIRPRWGRNPRIHVWAASASACDARGSSRDTPGFTSGQLQLQPAARQEVPEIPQDSRLGIRRRSRRATNFPLPPISPPRTGRLSLATSVIYCYLLRGVRGFEPENCRSGVE
jgi:hypothetical protein